MPLKALRRLISPAEPGLAGPSLLVIDGREVAVRYRRNARARRIVMRLDKQGNGIVLTVPPGTSARAAYEFAQSQSGWIWTRLERHRPEPADGFAHGCTLPVRGVPHVVEIAGGRGLPVRLVTADPPRLVVTGVEQHAARRVRDWLKREARSDLGAAVTRYGHSMGLSHSRISLRDTSSRWGSCSSGGNLSFSWRLIMAPASVLDYVAAHEIAHLREMNHGPAFWSLVRAHCPHTDEARGWLKTHGHTLHGYGL